MENIGIYVHIPFCMQKCYYCDFTSYPNKLSKQEDYVQALKDEIKERSKKIKNYIDTIYIGGGTPSIIDSNKITEILECIRNNYKVKKNAEITIEVNPGTVNRRKLECYYKVGINRLSIGLQSANDKLLKLIGRVHDFEDFLETVKLANTVGFTNINADCMIGLPNQTIYDVEETINTLINLRLTHVSVYSLIVEPGTPLEKKIDSGELKLPDEEIERYMYWFAKRKLEENGYLHYEISNFARPMFRSRHNMDCWKQKEYKGFGVSASSYENRVRYTNISNIEQYIKNIEEEKFEENYIVEEKQDRDFLCAKTAINMFIQANTVNIKETKAKFYSPEIDYNNYIAILENRNHPLFFQFQKLNQEHFSKTYKIRTNMNIEAEEKRKNKRIAEIIELEPQEIIKILSNVDTEEFELFCKAFNLSVRFFTNLIISNSTIKYEFTNKDTIREIYAKYKLEYKEIIEKVIEEICSLKESEFKEPLNLYEYYSHNSIDINYLARMALDYSDIKYRSLILKYIDIFKDPFSPINESAIESTKRIGIISCCSSSIKFTTSDITKAFKDMNEKDLPYIKGVLYGAIKKQQELKETKIKTKL